MAPHESNALIDLSNFTFEPTLETPGMDVIVPVGRTSMVDLGASGDGSAITLKPNGFQGRTAIGVDTNGHAVLTLMPTAITPPVRIDALQSGATIATLNVYPVPADVPTKSAMESLATLPDPASRDYTVITQRIEPFNDRFNGQSHASVRRVTVSGYRVVIQPGTAQGVWERLQSGGSPPSDLASLDIYAREIVIGGPLTLPGTRVRLYAETLRFKDGANVTAQIITTPLDSPDATNAGAAGLRGENGGDVFLNVGRVEDAGVAVPRFVLTGGRGQRGGPVRPRANGRNLPIMPEEPQIGGIIRSWNDIAKIGQAALPADWSRYETPKNVVWFDRAGSVEFGTRNVWPGNGESGTPGGQPGVGGNGGAFHSSIAVRQDDVVQAGGKSGNPREAAPGGAAGSPGFAVAIYIENRRFGIITIPFYNFYVHRSANGSAIASPAASAAQGATGVRSMELRGWLHPMAAQAILGYAEDLYRMGFLPQASAELTSLQNSLIADAVGSAPGDVWQRVQALLARLSSNLDYYGNPGGWVPALNFPVLLQALAAEVNASAPILIAAEQVRLQAEAGQRQVGALTTARDAASAKTVEMTSRLDTLANTLPQLQADATSVAQDEAALEKAVSDREQQLAKDAQEMATPRGSFLSSALKTIGTIAKFVPVGQPIVGAVGGALDLVADISQNTTWDEIAKIPSVASGFSQANVNASVASYKKLVGDVSSLDPTHPKQMFGEIASAATTIGNSLAQIRKAQEASRAPASAVDAILKKLEADDPSLNAFVQSASALNAKKGLLAQSIDGAIHEMGDVTSQISTLTSNLDAMNAQLFDAQSMIEHPGIAAAASMSRLLRQRLDYYQYLVIKSYEYYAAQPFTGNRRAAGTADSILDLLHGKANAADAANAYVASFQSEVREVELAIMRTLATAGPGKQKTIMLALAANELTALNHMLTPAGAGSNDLVMALEDLGLIPVTDLESRLVKVEVVHCDCHRVSGTSSANIELDVASAPDGIIRTTTRVVGFRQADGAPNWGATIDLTNDPSTVTQITAPADVGVLLAQILNQPAPPQAYMTAPPILPALMVRARLYSTDPTVAEIRQLQLQLTYSYRPVAGARGLRVITRSEQGSAPAYYVSRPDQTGAQHGYGNFTRMFSGTQDVTIVAPMRVGDEHFAGWYLKGTLAQAGNRLVLPAGYDSYLYEARFER